METLAKNQKSTFLYPPPPPLRQHGRNAYDASRCKHISCQLLLTVMRRNVEKEGRGATFLLKCHAPCPICRKSFVVSCACTSIRLINPILLNGEEPYTFFDNFLDFLFSDLNFPEGGSAIGSDCVKFEIVFSFFFLRPETFLWGAAPKAVTDLNLRSFLF